MIAYGILILLFILYLCTAHPHVMQPRYADNAVTKWTFDALHHHMTEFLVRGPLRGYLPEPTKRILVVSSRNFQQAEAHFHRMGLYVVTIIRYIGGFISDQESEKRWLADEVEAWTHLVEMFDGVAHRNLQTYYTVLQTSLQQEWHFVHSITMNIGEVFLPIEEALEKSFIPELFKGAISEVPLQGITCPSVKQAGLDISNKTLSAWENWTYSCVFTRHLVTAL